MYQLGIIPCLCDGPGFGDTAGPEVDIANSLGVIEALGQAQSVKLLALSSFDTLGGRGEGIRKLAHLLTNVMNEINERLYATYYVFTKYSRDRDINSLLYDIKTSQIDRDPILQSADAFGAVSSDMIEKSEDTCCRIDPLGNSPKDLLIRLYRMRSIQRSKDVFFFSLDR